MRMDNLFARVSAILLALGLVPLVVFAGLGYEKGGVGIIAIAVFLLVIGFIVFLARSGGSFIQGIGMSIMMGSAGAVLGAVASVANWQAVLLALTVMAVTFWLMCLLVMVVPNILGQSFLLPLGVATSLIVALEAEPLANAVRTNFGLSMGQLVFAGGLALLPVVHLLVRWRERYSNPFRAEDAVSSAIDFTVLWLVDPLNWVLGKLDGSGD